MRTQLVFVVALLAFLAKSELDVIYDFGILIDAGSSGSRLGIYQWPRRTNDTIPDLRTSPLNQTQWRKSVSPGISAFAEDLDGIPSYLEQMISYALERIPESKHNSTALFMKCTGGMRAIPEIDQENILHRVRSYFHTTPFNFSDSWASVIQLETEALYGWVAVNYLLKTLYHPEDTVGALDMGGESTEIAFVPSSPPLLHGSSITLEPYTYDVYTVGFNERGQESATQKLISWLISRNPKQIRVKNPCYLAGYSETFNTTSNITYEIFGTGLADDCSAIINEVLLNTSVPCLIKPCSFNGTYQPKLRGSFYAYSGYAFTREFLVPDNETVDIDTLRTATIKFCDLDWHKALDRFNSTDPQYLKGYCFNGNYFSNILSVYGFTNETEITFAASIGDSSLSYATGAMLHEADLLPYYPPTLATNFVTRKVRIQ